MEQIALSLNQVFGFSIAASTIVACLVGALWSIYFNRIKEGQKAEFQKQIDENKAEFEKQLENLKAKNEKCNYISKTQFDAEFKMYQELSKVIYDVNLKTSSLFPNTMNEIINQNNSQQISPKDMYTRALCSLSAYQEKVRSYAPFIEKNLYKCFDDYRMNINAQITFYKMQKVDELIKYESSDAEQNTCNNFKNNLKEIQNSYEEIIEKIREYLHTLKINED